MAVVYTDAGEAYVVDLIDGTISNSPAPTHYIHWGTGGATAPTKAQTTLVTPASEARAAATRSQPAADTNQWVATLTADGAKTIDEAGVFTASSNGTMVIRGNFTGIALALGDKIEFTVTLQQT